MWDEFYQSFLTCSWPWGQRSQAELSNHETLCPLFYRWRNWRQDVQRLANVLQLVHENSIPKYFCKRLFCSFLWVSSLSFLLLWTWHVTFLLPNSRSGFGSKSTRRDTWWLGTARVGWTWRWSQRLRSRHVTERPCHTHRPVRRQRGAAGDDWPPELSSHTSCLEWALLYPGWSKCHSTF